MIYIASDHGGFRLKEHLKKFLTKEGQKFSDLGPKKYNRDDDYPDYAKLVAQKISKNPPPLSLPLKRGGEGGGDVGILLCRSGQGVCIVANKFKNVRAVLVWNTVEAKMSRRHDMSNILCLPSDYISPRIAEHIVETWLETPFSKEERHVRRIKKISALESK